MQQEFRQDHNIRPDTEKSSKSSQIEWVFWIFGSPNKPQPQPFTKCLVHSDKIIFETHPSSPVTIASIRSCKMTQTNAGMSYNLNINIAFNQAHPVFGKGVYFMLVDPYLAMWGNDRASTSEYRAFEQLVNALKSGGATEINPNPYNRAQSEKNGLALGQVDRDAYQPPTSVKRPNVFLIVFFVVVLMVLMILLGLWYR